MKIKILHIIPGFQYGGIESRLVDWYKYIDREQIQFDVLKVTKVQTNENIRIIEELGGNVITVSPLGVKTWLKHISELEEVIKNGNYDIIHCHSKKYAYYSLKIAYKYGIKTRILHARTSSYGKFSIRTPIEIILGHASLRYVTHRFACSASAALWAFGTNENVMIVKNGVEVEKFAFNREKRNKVRSELSIGNNEYAVGFVGRFTGAKNISFLVDVFRASAEEIEGIKLILVGDGPLLTDIKHMVNEYELDDRVRFLGRRDDIPEIMNAFDILCLPSIYEGFPGVIVEAQANGLKCLVSNKVTNSVKMLNTLSFLSIESIDVWVEALMSSSGSKRLGNAETIVKNCGYDICTISKELENFYIHSIN